MAEFTFLQEPKSFCKKTSAAVSSGTIVEVVTGVYGYTKRNFAADELATYFFDGIGEIVKGATAFSAGDTIYWDATNKVAVATGTILIGTAIEAAASGDATVKIIFHSVGSPDAFSAGTNIASLTDNSGGTASATIAAISENYTQAEVANAVASLAAKVNGILSLLESVGVMADA